MPQAILGSGFIFLVLAWFGLLVVVKAVVLRLFRWAPFRRTLTASVCLNLVSMVLAALLPVTVVIGPAWFVAVITFQVIADAGILWWLDRSKLRTAIASTVVSNSLVYAIGYLVIIPLLRFALRDL